MNPYSAPAEASELSQEQRSTQSGHWVIWLGAVCILILLSVPLINSAVYRGFVSSELLASIILVAGVGCLNRTLEISRNRRPS
jgi:hypothetical protein